jgi:hypothetical protein
MKLHLIFSLALFVAVPTVHSQDALVQATNLGKMSYKEASDSVNGIIEQNRKLVVTLVGEIRQRDFPADSKLCAIYLLGELRPRDASAVDALMENIDFVATRGDIRLGIARWGKYPAEEALEKIGMPAVHVALTFYLPKEEDQLKRHLMCNVLQGALGEDNAITILKQWIAKESDPHKSANLELALRELEKN